MGAGGPGFAPDVQAVDAAAGLAQAPGAAAALAMTEGDGSLPVPTASPNADATLTASLDTAPEGGAGIDALNRGITQSSAIQPVTNLYSQSEPMQAAPAEPQQAAGATGTAALPDAPQTAPIPTASPNAQPQVAAAAPQKEPATAAAEPEPQPVALAVVAPPKKQSIFARLFSAQPTPPKSVPTVRKQVAERPQVQVASAAGGDNALPGVRASALFEITTGTDEDGENAAGVEYASAAGLARLSPNGLHLQTEKVDVACLKPNLVRVLRSIENHYGRDVVVTSGFRSPKHNRRIGGATGSKHTSCEAADIQVAGVTKWELAKYVRSMPGRGGVGTYCHTNSVHVDIGVERDWNWRCRRRK
ncbi:uncharacterized protein YcbK (DUF882 family) [Hoeflea marina]|uniref:Uncharacterized protein YcbK (DUF882 family) n=1 Tax=Hoeflea marina TaxID=274592 RepID=A0A317PU43_9HYPH|nr:D-Ala-D-Ala carboxypeptidase family metallohydrolase [Hoeflea marina]PWW03756.1 uncharacterized protein YcbK (DUF882 family) [Hoeflea marina]